jgi:hypothetical protein
MPDFRNSADKLKGTFKADWLANLRGKVQASS